MKKKTGKEELRFENELKKLKLNAERGMQFFSEDQKKLSPSVESRWLDNIKLFEEAADKKEVKKVKFLLGNPILPSVNTLSDTDLSKALDEVYSLMNRNNISLNVLYEVSERVLYQFITEELFDYEMAVINVPGMVSCFTYEEFHPNDEEDLKDHTIDFIKILMKQSFEFMDGMLSSKVMNNNEYLPSKEFIKRTSEVLKGMKLKLVELEISSVEIHEDHASVNFQISYNITQGNTTSNCNNIACLNFVHELGYWYIQKIKIPDLNI